MSYQLSCLGFYHIFPVKIKRKSPKDESRSGYHFRDQVPLSCCSQTPLPAGVFSRIFAA